MGNTYSYSKLDTYQQCPFKFYLKYIEGNYDFSNSIATECGTAIHAAEETIAKSIIAKQPIDYISIKNDILKVLFTLQNKYPKDFSEPDKNNKTYSDKIYSYLESGIYKLEQFMLEHPTYEIVGVEQAFLVKYKEQEFKGFIDRVFHDTATNKYIIQDIKTYAVEVEKDKLATPLQFVIYTLAVKELYNCINEQISCQYYLPFCELTQDAGTTGYMNRGIAKLDKLFTAINDKDYEPNNKNALCNWCGFSCSNPDAKEPYKYLCPYHCKWDRETRNKADLFKFEAQWEGLEKNKEITESYIQKVKTSVN